MLLCFVSFCFPTLDRCEYLKKVTVLVQWKIPMNSFYLKNFFFFKCIGGLQIYGVFNLCVSMCVEVVATVTKWRSHNLCKSAATSQVQTAVTSVTRSSNFHEKPRKCILIFLDSNMMTPITKYIVKGQA